eukprot:CAMPEP_0114262910 /NCGR_PEP_ID=MMETSP0058-20121206/22127_1 /TAXON_ID=36894 /ORGANISM="Pyramimonas parkeae, CCMP726" /LENGTH=152 /DNA_ID=CAMNT_0001378953 /DNA_START=30 /DNA_END=488 /DNA_ORIENTATION=+
MAGCFSQSIRRAVARAARAACASENSSSCLAVFSPSCWSVRTVTTSPIVSRLTHQESGLRPRVTSEHEMRVESNSHMDDGARRAALLALGIHRQLQGCGKVALTVAHMKQQSSESAEPGWQPMQMSSVKKKRVRKMNKHKHRKRLKLNRHKK